MYKRQGLEASSGYGVACKIVNFAMLIPSALMQSMASFISQNIGAGKHQRARQTLRTGIGIGLFFGLFVFALVLCKGDLLCSFFTTDAPVIANGYAYLKGFALETILTALDSGDYGHILRAKGIVNGEDGWLEFDYVPEEHEVRAGHPDYTGRLCVIGAELKEDGLAELFGV